MPTTVVGLIVVVGAFAPGYAWIRVAEARKLRADRSPLLETVELGLVGAAATLISAAAVGLISESFAVGLADLQHWALQGSLYFENHPVKVLLTLAAIVVLSTFSAWAAARVAYRRYPPVFGPERTVWSDVLAGSGQLVGEGVARTAFIAARTKDDRIIEGYLFSFPSGPSDTVSEVALQAPIFVRDTPRAERVKVANTQFLLLLVTELKELAVRFEDVKVRSR